MVTRNLRNGEAPSDGLEAIRSKRLLTAPGNRVMLRGFRKLRTLTRRASENSPRRIRHTRPGPWTVSRTLPTTPKGPCARVRTRAGS